MTGYIEVLKKRYITDKEHKKFRKEPIDKYEQAYIYKKNNLTDLDRTVARLKYVLEAETPVVFKDEKLALIRTVPVLPEIFTPEEFENIEKHYYIHEQGKVCNICPEYTLLLEGGFKEKRHQIIEKLKMLEDTDVENKMFLEALLATMDTIEAFAEKYRVEAIRVGNKVVAESFKNIPREKPKNFLEALQFLRLIHYCLWASFNYHNTLGRFDQYMYPYYIQDVEAGILNEETALELIEEFFICCNKDSDLYTGMQQGDNGQSLVLGGLRRDGTESYNQLSELCLKACEELKLIDPKINLRVNKGTPLSVYERGTQLTKLGLGFPQYSNDDIVIPCLKYWGYDDEDAYNYAVAACWEFIIPGYGMDIPNINGLSFVSAVQQSMEHLEGCIDFEQFMEIVKETINNQVDKMIDEIKNVYMEPAPLMSLVMQDTIVGSKDISKGNKYNNYGFHGTGLSTATDSLAAIREYVFEKKCFTASQMIDMVEKNFEGFDKEENMLRYEAPKMGNDDDRADEIAIKLLDWFADSVYNKKNRRGGIYRAGTGSAMYYIWHSQNVGATADGRKKDEPLACNYSPSLFCRCRGPISIIKSFAKPDLKRVANGGPLTIELHDTVFRNEDSIQKVAMFVKSFMDMGGHQIQINAINRDTIIDAKKHPELYKNLIVRVWGWSGYFVELDEVYQDHIIERMELQF